MLNFQSGFDVIEPLTTMLKILPRCINGKLRYASGSNSKAYELKPTVPYTIFGTNSGGLFFFFFLLMVLNKHVNNNPFKFARNEDHKSNCFKLYYNVRTSNSYMKHEIWIPFQYVTCAHTAALMASPSFIFSYPTNRSICRKPLRTTKVS